MTGVQYLACVWALFITQTRFVCSDIQFLERNEGGSVVFHCAVEQWNLSPFGVYLKRSWLHPSEVLFMYTKSDFTLNNDDDKNRISVSGDPSSHTLNLTVSQLSASDTDRYYCEFLVANPTSEDEQIRGKTEFFLLVNADAPGSVDIGLVETCSGGSAVIPCLPPHGKALAVEGVNLKRQRGRAPVEVLYHSKHHYSSSSPSAASSSQFPVERVQLSSAPGPRGITYNLTLKQLQPDDSALYSCQLLLSGGPATSTSLGRQAFFVSVQANHLVQKSPKILAKREMEQGVPGAGDQCGCSNYSTLLYALSSAVGVLLLLLLLGFVVIYKGKARRSVKSHPQAPIYEEMTGLQHVSRKLAPRHLEEMEASEYRNCSVKKSCPENHYESPIGVLRSESLK